MATLLMSRLVGKMTVDNRNLACASIIFCKSVYSPCTSSHYPVSHYYGRSEIEGFLSNGVLKFYHVSFSQYDQPPDGTGHDGDSIDVRHRYVQDNMRKHWEDLSHWIMEENAYVYVCG